MAEHTFLTQSKLEKSCQSLFWKEEKAIACNEIKQKSQRLAAYIHLLSS